MPNELMKEKLWEIEQLQARIAELERRIANAVDSATAAQNCIKMARVDTYKAMERIKYILTSPPKEGE